MQTRQPNGQIVYQEDYSCIVQPQNGKGGIFIGNLEAAENIKTLKKHGIRAVLTAAKGVEIRHPKSEVPFYLQVPGEDHEGFDLSRFFPQSINFIQDSLQNTNIMIHCLAGVSRSVCLVLAYLIKNQGYSYDQAYSLVKSKRSIIHPNDGFIGLLRKLESEENKNANLSKEVYHQSYSLSPSKKRYGYCEEEDQGFSVRLNPENYLGQKEKSISNRCYESPSKRGYGAYISPSKRTFNENGHQYEIGSGNLDVGKMRKEYNYYDFPSSAGLKKFQYHQESEVENIEERMRAQHFSPDKKSDFYIENRRRTSSIIEPKRNTNGEAQRLIGNYDRIQHPSTFELSQELDNKIAAIRQKYSDYTKNEMNKSRISREFEPKVNNYLDEYDGLRYGVKRIDSNLEGFGNRYANYGIIRNNFNRSSISGLGLKKLNSLREGY